MSAFKGTPGPWLAGDNFVYALNADGVNRFFCGIQSGWIAKGIQNRTPDSELAANAHLIAAAPELLGQHEADMVDLELLAKAIHAGDPMPELVIRVTDMLNRKRAAIAKATGGSA